MSGLSFFFGLASLVIALVAAEYWKRASDIPIPTDWTVDPENELASYVQWIIAIKDATEKGGLLNAKAAKLTAASVVLAAVAAVLSAISQAAGH